MRKFFAKFILRLSGWSVTVKLPEEKKFVLIGAPHTSNWDLPLALLCMWSVNRKLTWVAKKQIFIGPFNYFFRALGGLPVDRSAPGGLIKQIADLLKQQDTMIFGITPEGTRSNTDYWKTGFYYIATEAKVPVCMGYVDFPSRTIGFETMLYPDGNIAKDFEKIAVFYSNKKGRFPEKQGAVKIKEH